MFDNHVCVITLEVVENDIECSAFLSETEVACFAKWTAIFSCYVTVVPNLNVFVFIKFCVTSWTVLTCFEVFFLLRGKNHCLSCHFAVSVMLLNGCVF